jgi:hypothetical protein
MHATCTNYVTVIITSTKQSLSQIILNKILYGKVPTNRIQPRALPYLSVVTDNNVIGRSVSSLSVNGTRIALCEEHPTVNSSKYQRF